MADDASRAAAGNHRRTRSAMVSSLLVKSHSRTASAAVTPSSSQQFLSAAPGNPAASNTAGVNNSTAPPVSGSAGSVRSLKSDSISQQPSEMVDSTTSLRDSGILIGGSGGTKSVEDTVRTFRLYEALRSGDTSAISRAIRDSGDESGRRTSISTSATGMDLNKATILHLAVQCAELPVIEYIISTTASSPEAKGLAYLDINQRDPNTGNTPLHLAAYLGRADVVNLLLKQPGINDSLHNYNNRTPLEIARNPQIYQMLQLEKSLYIEEQTERLHQFVAEQAYDEIEALLDTPRVKGLLDLNTLEAPTNGGGSTLLHDAARMKDTRLIELLLLRGADPFRRDRKGKLPQEVTKDEKTRGVLKKSPAAQAAARGIEERAVLGSAAEAGACPNLDGASLGGKEGREMKGFLKKWTNYTGGYKLRWFVLEDGVLSYYKNQEDIGSACRGAINMRIAKLHMDPHDKERFEIIGKSSVKYHLKANHQVEAKRWYWTLNNAIQWAKDEAREEERRKNTEAERLGRIREQHKNDESEASSVFNQARRGSKTGSVAASYAEAPGKRASVRNGSQRSQLGGDGDESDFYDPSTGPTPPVIINENGEDTDGQRRRDDDDDDDTSSHGPTEPPSSDTLTLAANSARLQLDLLSQVVLALQFEHARNPELTLSDPTVSAALTSYESAVGNLKGLVGDLLIMGKERDSYWRWKIDKEIRLRRLWEENMTVLARQQEELEGLVVGERDRRRKTKRVLREMLRKESVPLSRHEMVDGETGEKKEGAEALQRKLAGLELDTEGVVRRETVRDREQELGLSSDDSDENDEFFDAIDSGEVGVMKEMPPSIKVIKHERGGSGYFEQVPEEVEGEKGEESKEEVTEEEEVEGADKLRVNKLVAIRTSFKGYEDPPRARLSMDADDRPKISLWGILKSMIGKDMTKMTLPVSFNEPTSLLQRVAEDMEYTDLLDTAADRVDPAERMVFVAAFAASEYSSTINRVAKPFNPLLGETYEYCCPEKSYRFFIEQVSHHPPIGAAWSEGEKWDYWGESAVKSKFYGKSFDINPLGTWFLRLRPSTGGEELYTWKKVTTSVIGIITGSPTIDNYGLMEIKNHTTGESCLLDFKPRGWRVSNAYEVKGRILDSDGFQKWSIGGRWNDKIYARLSPGYDANISPPPSGAKSPSPNSAFLVWENHPRPPAPFNLTPFSITLNALPENLKPHLCPTDTRLRPDQRAMEEGEYDFAATEKNRLEEKQRSKRRERETKGEEWEPRWFRKSVCKVTGEEFWELKEYWDVRKKVSESGVTGVEAWKVEDIF